jgi:RimJ/RimL family protein N-acetyltransferase
MIRKVTNTDFSFVYSLYMHPKVNPFLLYEMMDEESFKPIFQDLLKDEVLYVYENDEKPVGMFKLIRLKHRADHVAYLGGLAIHPDFAGQGFGKKMLQEIIDLGKEMGLLRIELSAATHNLKAIRLYESVGFEKEGVLRRYTNLKSEGRILDEVLMSYLY